jgi:hypothetical protein
MRKTLQSRIAKSMQVKPLNLIIHGGPQTEFLDNNTFNVNIVNRNTKNHILGIINTLNMLGVYSGASNQFEGTQSIFLISKTLHNGIWMDRNLKKNLDFNVYINPEITGVSEVKKFAFLNSL